MANLWWGLQLILIAMAIYGYKFPNHLRQVTNDTSCKWHHMTWPCHPNCIHNHILLWLPIHPSLLCGKWHFDLLCDWLHVITCVINLITIVNMHTYLYYLNKKIILFKLNKRNLQNMWNISLKYKELNPPYFC
jgi:hypothetical protein